MDGRAWKWRRAWFCACEEVTAALPRRVAFAAALWFATALCKDEASSAERGADGTLRRLEACSGVPARFIVAAESRIARFAERVRVAEEGWAERSEPNYTWLFYIFTSQPFFVKNKIKAEKTYCY